MTISNHDLIEVTRDLTPGEQFQNWLAQRGVGEPVQVRTLYQPEPPPGLWVMINGATALGAVAAIGYLLWLVTAYALPELVHAVT